MRANMEWFLSSLGIRGPWGNRCGNLLLGTRHNNITMLLALAGPLRVAS